MPPALRTDGFVYRLGNLSNGNFTPRPGDLEEQPGLRLPGLSTLERLPPGREGFRIDLARLMPPLRAFADDPEARGLPGHVTIVPVDEKNEVDRPRLVEWINSRGGDSIHPWTQLVLDAVISGRQRSSS